MWEGQGLGHAIYCQAFGHQEMGRPGLWPTCQGAESLKTIVLNLKSQTQGERLGWEAAGHHQLANEWLVILPGKHPALFPQGLLGKCERMGG